MAAADGAHSINCPQPAANRLGKQALHCCCRISETVVFNSKNVYTLLASGWAIVYSSHCQAEAVWFRRRRELGSAGPDGFALPQTQMGG